MLLKEKIKQADNLVGTLLRQREHSCQACGKNSSMFDTAHIFPRRYMLLRFDIRNVLLLCRECHTKFTANPTKWTDFVSQKWPLEFVYLKLAAREIFDIQEWEIDNIIKALQYAIRNQQLAYLPPGYVDMSDPAELL